MRARHMILTAAAILIAFGAKLFFFPVPTAEADVSVMMGAGLDVSQLQQGVKDLPMQKMHDMSLVFSQPN